VGKRRTLIDIRYCIKLLHLLHALMLLIPTVLLTPGLGGHVGISVPAISSSTPLGCASSPLKFALSF
jgi:hypothetical protein